MSSAPAPAPPPVPADPAGHAGRGKEPAFRIQELRALHSRALLIFLLLLVLALTLVAYMVVRIFVLGDVRSYLEVFSLCFFAVACVALTLAQMHCLRRIRSDTRDRIESLTFTDELTGAHNYRFIEQRLTDELQRARRYGLHLSVIYFDIDHFKMVNDTFGHETGNEVLRRVAAACRISAREGDFVGRLGGDEFLIVLPETDTAGATIMAERVKERLDALDLRAASGEPIDFLAFSLGVASYPNHAQDRDGLIRAADEAMYRAKRSGGNRVCL